jgi:hypothetical protein
MDNKTNRGKLVRKYIGEEIEKFKFEYKGYQNDSWKYERKFKGVIQTISIYPYRFEQRKESTFLQHFLLKDMLQMMRLRDFRV